MSGTMMRRDRRGFTIFGDLVWVVVFCVAAMLLFFFLYKPLVDEIIDEKANRKIGELDLLPIYGDAQYIALGIAQSTPDQGTTGRQYATVMASVRSFVESRSVSTRQDRFNEAVAASGYRATLDRLFAEDSLFWTQEAYNRPDGTEVAERRRVAIIVHYDNAWLQGTCREYTPRGGDRSSSLCARFVDGSIQTSTITRSDIGAQAERAMAIVGAVETDPDTGITIPVFGNVVEPGSIHVPTNNGPATLFVFVLRRED